MSRTLDLERDFSPWGRPAENQRLQEWLRLNGIDPLAVPLNSSIIVDNEKVFYTRFFTDDAGAKRIDPGDPRGGYVRLTESKDLLVPPRKLQPLDPIGANCGKRKHRALARRRA